MKQQPYPLPDGVEQAGWTASCRMWAERSETSLERAEEYMTEALDFVRVNFGEDAAGDTYADICRAPGPSSPILRAMRLRVGDTAMDPDWGVGLDICPGEPPDRLSTLGICTIVQEEGFDHYLINHDHAVPPLVLLDDALMEAELEHISMMQMLEQYKELDPEYTLARIMIPLDNRRAAACIDQEAFTRDLPVIGYRILVDQDARATDITYNPAWEARRDHLPQSQESSTDTPQFTARFAERTGGRAIQIPFPVDEDVMMGRLSGLSGESPRNFLLVEIDGDIPELSKLAGHAVDVDDLNYLAKRLDSYDKNEKRKFGAVLQTYPPESLGEMITLTYDLHNYALITDFADPRRVGVEVRFAQTGGYAETGDCDSHGTPYVDKAKELERYPYKISSHGPVYKIGTSWAEPYDGRCLPPYLWRDMDRYSLVGLSPRVEDTDSLFWLELPAAAALLESAAMRLGVDSVDDLCIAEVDNAVDILEAGWALSIFEEPVREINELCHRLQSLDSLGRETLRAAAELSGAYGAQQLTRLAEHIDEFRFIPGVSSPEAYGKYMIRDSGHYEYDPNLDDAGGYDYREVGLRRIKMENGDFYNRGYIYYGGVIPMKELLQGAPLEQRQDEAHQGPTL